VAFFIGAKKMAIQLPNPGLGDGQTGDNEFVMWTKVKDNFSNTTHAASRLVGVEAGNVLPAGTGGLGSSGFSDVKTISNEFGYLAGMQNLPHLQRVNIPNAGAWGYPSGVHFKMSDSASFGLFYTHFPTSSGNSSVRLTTKFGETTKTGYILASGINAFPDSNGFWKTSSPVVKVYANEIDPNDDAEKQGVTFTRNGVGDYTLHNTLGLAQKGWTITLPEDNNRNPLVAIETEELENGDLNIRTYKRIFSMETFTFTCDYDNPLDIPEGRCVDVRLHEILPEVTDEPIE